VSNIVLRNLEKQPAVQQSERQGYIYKDLALDLVLSFTNSGELFKKDDQQDLKPSYDQEAIMTSLRNILTTTPGDKLLNPTFGLDLRSFLFDPVTDTRAFFIGNKIYDGITIQEPRVKINTISVIAIMDQHEYDITLNISVPSLNIFNLSLKSILNMDGYNLL
jgi:phage baseplate assembly protein W